MPGVDVRIVAITDGVIATLAAARELPPGEIGEIIVHGPVVTRSYDALPEATAAAKIHATTHPAAPAAASASALSPFTLHSSPFTPPADAIWHRMGDCGYLDPLGRLWFCGRKVERVLTAQGPLFTEPVEQVFRSHPHVARCALVGLGVPGKQLPALVVQRRRLKSRPALPDAALARELRELARAHTVTAGITRFYFHNAFPVDVRHNAKIHRLTLAKWAEAHASRAVMVDA